MLNLFHIIQNTKQVSKSELSICVSSGFYTIRSNLSMKYNWRDCAFILFFNTESDCCATYPAKRIITFFTYCHTMPNAVQCSECYIVLAMRDCRPLWILGEAWWGNIVACIEFACPFYCILLFCGYHIHILWHSIYIFFGLPRYNY